MSARRTCEQCGSLMPAFVPRKTVGGHKVCEGCRMWHAKTAMTRVAQLENPIHGKTGKDPHEWYHGSKHEFHEFGDPEDHSQLAYEDDSDDTSHWNTLLGNHFTSDHQVAADFAQGQHSSANNSSSSESGRVIHTKLHLKNPKVYASEHDMDQEVHEFEHARGNTISSHFPPLPEDADEYDKEDHLAEMGQAQHYADDADKPFGRHDADPGQAYGSRHPKAVGWLNSHPDMYNIAARFKDRLKDQGHDGIVYGNEYEQSRHGRQATSAIAFHPHQIEITQDHTVNKNCLKPGDLARRPGPGQEMIPGTEHMPQKRPFTPAPGKWTHPVTWHDPKMWRESKMTPHGVDWGRLTAPLPQECWDRYYGRHTAAGKPLNIRYMHSDEDYDDPENEYTTRHRLHALDHEHGQVGTLDYFEPRHEGHPLVIDYMDTHPQHRGKGVASGLADELQRRYLGVPVDPGEFTDQGAGWAGKYLEGKPVRNSRTMAKRAGYKMKYTRMTRNGYEDAEKEIEGPLYHGGRGKLQPGDMITPGRKPNSWGDEGPKSTHVYFSQDKDTAASYSQQLGNKGHLYEVEPTGEFKPDYGPQDYKTQHPLRVVRKVPREEWQLGSTASNSNDPWRWEQHQTRWDTKRPTIEHTKDLGAFTLHAEPVNEDGDREIHAVTPEGRYIGSTYFGQHPSLTSYQEGAPEVHPDHRRRGVASAMYDWAEELGGKPMAPAVSHTEDAAGFWSTRKQATVYPKHETALHEMGKQTVYPVSTPRGVTDLCQHHLNVHQSISAGSNDLAGHLGIPQAPSEPLGASKTGTYADCNKNTDYMLKLQRPEGFDRQQQRDSQQPRTRRSGSYVPRRTAPLTPLRQSENARSGASDNEIRRSRNGSLSFLRDETTNSVVSGGSNRRAPAPALDHLRGSTFSQVSRPVSSQRSGMSVKKEDRMKKLPTLRMLAHDATENQELRHCPFCGGGKIIGRQDGTVECQFCHQFFTVQVQPQFPNFPQTVDGMPQQIPGMPGQVETPPGATVPGQEMPPGEEGSEDGGNPFASGGDGDADDAGGPPDGDADDKGGDEPPPFAKKSFRTVTGALLDEESYARHLAIRLAPDRDAMIALVRQEQGAR